MRTRLQRILGVTALSAAATASVACSPNMQTIDGGLETKSDGGNNTLDASKDTSRNTSETDSGVTTHQSSHQGDGSTSNAGTTEPRLDAGLERRDSGANNDASFSADSAASGVDLTISSAAIDPVAFTSVDVADANCAIQDGCYGGSGKRTLIPFELTIKNAGQAPLQLGAPWESSDFYLSACSSQYLTTNFVQAEVLSPNGEVLAVRRLPTSCVANEDSNTYSCSLQGLQAGETSTQPNLACEGLDVTGLAAGAYTVRFTINADGRFAETDSSNNTIEVQLEKPECDARFCGGVCCPESAECVDNVCALPDLRANQDAVERSLIIQKQTFGENSCEISEMCITGPGKRRLLQFEGRIENAGVGDLNPGAERNNPLFEHSECHGHYHFLDFTDYRLLTQDGTAATIGHKQSFCLVNMEPVEEYTGPAYGYPPVRPEPGDTGCSYLSAGWADIYGVGTPCQWVDITDVEPGDYILQVTVNPKGKIAESNVDNNVIQVPVTIPPDSSCQEAEICGDIVDQDCDGYPDSGDSDCIEELCCGEEDTCNLGHNWSCDCDGQPAWEHEDCEYDTGGGYPVPECCNEEDSCNWQHDGECDCNGNFEWDALDCSYDYYPDDECCTPGDYCGWANDGACDCGGQFQWDADDCDDEYPPSETDGSISTSPVEAGVTSSTAEAGLPSEAGANSTPSNAGDGAADAQ
jgi:hypothetical protein